jgi:glycosyltransferase involved in cell wall biosynthesis
MSPGCAVILSTYNQPEWLEKALRGYAVQTAPAFDLIVADDGSRPETARVIDDAERAGIRLRHVWHEDDGFRKCEILNKAVLATDADYLIFSDGDCIPRRDFVATHLQLAQPRRFLSGGVIWLDRAVSQRVSGEDIRLGRLSDAAWLRANGWKGGRQSLRLTPNRWLARALDALTPTSATFNGHNTSVWRTDLLAVNGFDVTMGYGGEDRAVGERLENIGVRGKQVRHRACCFHLDHDRPYKQEDVMRANRAARTRIVKDGDVRATIGIQEIAAAGATRQRTRST